MNKDLGIISINLHNDKNTHSILQLAKTVSEYHPYNQVCIFSSSCNTIVDGHVPILHISQSKFFNGNLIVLDIDGLDITSSFPNIHKRLFFATELPWTKQLKPYRFWEKLFISDNLEIVAKDNVIYDLFEICWKKPICLSEELNYETISKII